MVFYFLIGCIIFISSGRHNIIYWLSGLVYDRSSFVCSCGEQANNKLEENEEQGGLMCSYRGTSGFILILLWWSHRARVIDWKE